MQLNHSDNQQTIATEVSMSGVGIHSGQTVDMHLKPAEPNTGIVFKQEGSAIGRLLYRFVKRSIKNSGSV